MTSIFCQFGSDGQNSLLDVMEDGSCRFGPGVMVTGVNPDKLRLSSVRTSSTMLVRRDTATISSPEFGSVKLYDAVMDLLGDGAVVTFYDE